MSNPPVQPPTPDAPEPGGQPEPDYGHQAPQYGQQPPQAPQYGQAPSAPQYGQQPPQAPQYGQAPSAPQYGQQPPQAPQYGQAPSAPQYGQQAPQYGQQAPQPQYGQNAPQLPQYGQQAPQYGQPAYGQSPYAQYPSDQAQVQGGMPKLVNTAFWLIVASGVVWVVSLLIGLATLDTPDVRNMFDQQMAASGTKIDFNAIKGFLVGTIVVFAAVSAGLYALVAINVRKGKNWARILGTVFAALSVFSIFPLSIGTVAALAGIAGIVLLYLPATSPYFRKPEPFTHPYGQPGNPFGK